MDGCSYPVAKQFCDAAGKVKDAVVGQVSDAVGGAFSQALQELAGNINASVGTLFTNLLTYWTKPDTPDLGSSQSLATVQSSLSWYTALVAVACLIIVGARMAISANTRAAMDGFKGLVILAVSSLSAVAIVATVIKAGDAFAEFYLGSLDKEKLGETFARLTTTSIANNTLVLVIISGLLGLLAGLVQVLLLYVRFGALVVLVGILPLVAASATTQAGMAWFRRIVAWITAFALYKPIAAIIYGVSFTMIADSDLMTSISGMLLSGLAILALPALMKLAVPAIGAVSISGGSGGGVASASALATGARMVVDLRAKGANTASSRPAAQPGPTGNAAAGAQRPAAATPPPPPPPRSQPRPVRS